MAIDYSALANIAKALVDENGRNITLERFDQSFVDANKPWQGPANPRTTPDATVTVKAVFVPPSGAGALGLSTKDDDLLKRVEQICIVAPGTAVTTDLATMTEIVDDLVRYKIEKAETLAPNTVTLLYIFWVRR